MKAIIVAISGVLAPFVFVEPSFAWSGFTHELICQMAYDQLEPATQKKILKTYSRSGYDDKGNAFAKDCNTPDTNRRTTHIGTYEYHFINVPRGSETIDFSRDCDSYDCVTQGIIRYATYLQERRKLSSQKNSKKKEALNFLAHYVGDLHQPLHVGHKEDMGGNALWVKYASNKKNKRLHSVWDGTLPTQQGLNFKSSKKKRRLIASQQIAKISENDKRQWAQGSVNSWARESYSLSINCAYRRDCSASQPTLKTGDTLSQTYYDKSGPIAVERIHQASVRLAFILEDSFAGELDLSELDRRN
ncbi:MAG: hypothetical protein COA69_06740 [Robiginitomaculum sp.]|nr:MAG: hypothetical protein COA69_06740 [Robiginitomaculum sp.]